VALFLAILVGLALGLLGGGGSMLSVAVLSFVLGMPPNAAITASLAHHGCGQHGDARTANAGAGLVSVRIGVVLGGAGMVGAFAVVAWHACSPRRYC